MVGLKGSPPALNAVKSNDLNWNECLAKSAFVFISDSRANYIRNSIVSSMARRMYFLSFLSCFCHCIRIASILNCSCTQMVQFRLLGDVA